MNELADSLSLAGAAISVCDIDGLEQRIREQENLCGAIRGLDVRLESLQALRLRANQASKSSSTLIAEQADKSLRITLNRLQEVHCRVKSLNAVHAELLRRSRRTVRALSQAYQSLSIDIYSNPASHNSQVEERV